MSRYIDAEWIRNIYSDFEHYENRDDWTTPITNVLAVIDDAPSIDIVRCSECAYCNVQNTKYLYAICERHGIEFKPFEDDTRTHYCAWGERRTDE